MRELSLDELKSVSGGIHTPNSPPWLLDANGDQGGDGYGCYCMSIGVGACIALGTGGNHGSMQVGFGIAYGAGIADDGEAASDAALDAIDNWTAAGIDVSAGGETGDGWTAGFDIGGGLMGSVATTSSDSGGSGGY